MRDEHGREDSTEQGLEQTFAKRLRELREWLGVSQADLARRMTELGFRMHQTAVAKIERGERPLRLDEAGALAYLLDTDLSLMTGPLRTGDPAQLLVRELERSTAHIEESSRLSRVLTEELDRVVDLRRRLLSQMDELVARNREAEKRLQEPAEMPSFLRIPRDDQGTEGGANA